MHMCSKQPIPLHLHHHYTVPVSVFFGSSASILASFGAFLIHIKRGTLNQSVVLLLLTF